GVLPVKTDSRSLARKLKSLKRCRQRPGNSVKQGRWLSLAILLTRLFAGSPLFRFDLLPVSQYFSRVSRAGLAENMRVAANHLVMNRAYHVGHREAALFLRNLRMKDDLQEQRSEERRVGKECRCRRWREHEKKNKRERESRVG